MDKSIAADREFQEDVLTGLDIEEGGYVLRFGEGASSCLFCPKVHGVTLVPKIGMKVRTYGRGMGFPVRGIVIEGVVFRYQSATEYRRTERAEAKKRDQEKREKYERDRPKLEARVAALPEPLRARFDKFASTNPDFWPEFGEYELFTCEEAAKIADHFKGDAEGLKAWSAMEDYDAQSKMLPLSDQHSGNTFGMACRLAWWLVTDPPIAAKEHGALVGLVGCKDYGCPHPKESKS